MLKCPYCYEVLKEKVQQCPHCQQFIIDDIHNIDYPSLEKKACIYCGKKIVKEARFCKYCQKWLDELDSLVNDLDLDNLFED